MLNTFQNQMVQWSYESAKKYADPFNDVDLSAQITDPDGLERLAPAFWAGGGTWRVRYASNKTGVHHFRTICSDAANPDLHNREGDIAIAAYEGNNPLLRHGFPKISKNRKYFTYGDGTPFFWLGDTWWMGLCSRLRWPDDFHRLTSDRIEKGFTVVQIVAGLYPDMPPFDERGASEAGFPWTKDFTRINPEYFDLADIKIGWLVKSGLVPCIVGCWGYFLKWMGPEKMKKHWRYLVARYGAYPVLWCLAGEGAMPYYLSEEKERDKAFLKAGWSDMGTYLHRIDPYGHPVSVHAGGEGFSSRSTVSDESILDFNMLQTGHSDRTSIPDTADTVMEEFRREPAMPVIDSEVCYEGIGEACRQEVQRIMFWICILNGAPGHTYGANGIWQVNTRERPYGASPHGMSWGNTAWDDAFQLPGSKQLGLAAAFLQRYPWWRFEPHPEWIEPHASKNDYMGPYASGIPGEVRIIYFPCLQGGRMLIKDLEPCAVYRAFLLSPVDGTEYPLGQASGDRDGCWILHEGFAATGRFLFPIYQDWILVLERCK